MAVQAVPVLGGEHEEHEEAAASVEHLAEHEHAGAARARADRRRTGQDAAVPEGHLLHRYAAAAVDGRELLAVESGPSANGCTRRRPRVSDPGAPDERWVYKRETCRSCGAAVATAEVGGRTAYWCPVEQPG